MNKEVKRLGSKEVQCMQCGVTFKRAISELKKSENHFCSRSCAAKTNNTKFKKRKLDRKCLLCDEVVKSYRHNRCEKHHQEYKENKHRDITVGEYRNKPSVVGKHPSWVNSHVRNFSRSWNKELLKLPCAKCGYEKHVELAHIKAISKFSDDTQLSEINSPSNIIQLCPNCHWEFDNGYREEFKELVFELGKTYSEE